MISIHSGDDHDYCEYTHSIPFLSEGPDPKINYVREVTVKAISSAENIRRPGLQLLSLASLDFPRQAPSCLPMYLASSPTNEISIYSFLVISLIILLYSMLRAHRGKQQHTNDYQYLPHSGVDVDIDQDCLSPSFALYCFVLSMTDMDTYGSFPSRMRNVCLVQPGDMSMRRFCFIM